MSDEPISDDALLETVLPSAKAHSIDSRKAPHTQAVHTWKITSDSFCRVLMKFE